MSTHAGIGFLQPNGLVEGVYCHSDGYLEYVGKILSKCYNGTRLIKQLVSYGDFSSLEAEPSDIDFYDDSSSLSRTYSTEEFSSEFEYNYVWVPAIRKWFVSCSKTRWNYVPLLDALKGRFSNVVDLLALDKKPEVVTPVEPKVSGGMNPSQQDVEDFFTGASTMINRKRRIIAAEDEEYEDPRITEVEDLQDRVEDDFGYVMTGIERLGREGMLDEAIELLNTLADTLDSAIGIIGGDFESGSDTNPDDEI